MSKIKVGSQFSGVGAFEQSLIRLGIEFKNIYAADWDRYARQTYLLNFEEPEYYVKDVHDTPIQELTEKHGSLDIAMFSPPCQAFSMAGKRMGKDDQRGILFFNSLEFIKENKPRYFIFENVKGLLSHDRQDKNAVYGRTFQEWINYLGGKSVNGVHTFFPYEDSVPYHIYFQVLNAKHYGIPQNRERVFIIGIRDDEDNDFQFPKPFPLEKRLKDVLESEVDEKYFLSDKLLSWISGHREKRDSKGKYPYTEDDATSGCITARYHKMGAEDVFIGTWRTHEDGKGFRATEDNNCPTIPARAREDGSGQPVVKISAFRGRNPENSSDRTTGANLKQTLEINESGTSNALTSVQKDNVVIIGEIINPLKDKTEYGWHFEQAVYDSEGITRSLKSTEGSGNKPKVVINSNTSKGFDEAEEEEDSINFSVPSSKTRRGRVGKKVSQTLDTQCNQGIATKQLSKQQIEKLQNLEVDENIAGCITEAIGRAGSSDEYISSVKRNAMITQRIRRLTPRECFRLMDFNEDFIERTLNSKKYLYFQFVYSKFDINKKETLCNAKLKVVKDMQTQKNLETYVLCTTKECQKMDALTTLKQRIEIKTENNENPLNVNFAIEVLGELERKECVTNTIKWTDCTETLYMLMKEGKNQVVKDISEIQKDKSYIEKSLKITLEENLSEEKLFITLILLKQIMTSKIYTYVKMPLNTQRFISSTVVYEKKSERLLLSYLKMEYTEQVVSDSMLYKQAGNSICVGVLAAIISKLKF